MVIGENFSGWMHIYASGMVRLEIRQAAGLPASVIRQFPDEEQAEQWVDEFSLMWDEATQL